MQKFAAKLTICRHQGLSCPDLIGIEVETDTYRRVIELEISMEAFAKALTGLASQDCKAIWYGASEGEAADD